MNSIRATSVELMSVIICRGLYLGCPELKFCQDCDVTTNTLRRVLKTVGLSTLYPPPPPFVVDDQSCKKIHSSCKTLARRESSCICIKDYGSTDIGYENTDL